MQIFLADEAASIDFAQRFATILQPDLPHSHILLFLRGDLGAGKTCITRAILQTLGVTGAIKSPTYALSESYHPSGLEIYHFDFYRFNHENEWLEAGFRENFLQANLSIVEWPEKGGRLLPTPDIEIYLEYQDNGRTAYLTAFTPKAQKWIQKI